MFLWFIFYTIELSLVSLANITTDTKSKKLLYSFSAFIAIYFSAFRDGLGTDYKGYIQQLGSWGFDGNFEPLFYAIKNIISGTNFSPVLFFTFSSIVTIWFFWKYFDNKHNEFASLSIIIFLSLPGFYFNTFNIVRQYFSAALFLYSLKYIQSKQLISYTLCIVLACMMHLSSIILFPLYFVLNKKFPIKIYIIFTVILIFTAYSLEPIFNAITVLSDRYSVYLDTEKESGSSTITFLCLIILIIYFIKTKRATPKILREESSYIVMTINMFILYTLFSLITSINFYFYRLSFFFSASLCIMIPFILYQILKNRASVTIVCLLFSFVYFYTFITMGKDNPEICSENILPISSLFDKSPI